MITKRPKILRGLDPGTSAAALILLLMACFGPLYFGSVLPRERAALQIGAFLALAAVVAGRRALADLEPAARPALAVALIGAFGIVQALPWPRALAALLAPEIAEIWTRGAGVTGRTTAPLSLAPSVSHATGIHWLAVAACLAAACAVGSDRRLRRVLVAGVAVAAVFEIVYGSDNWFAQRSTILGVEVGGDATRLRGTFVNPDHLAFFLTMVCAGGFAWIWWSVRRVWRRGAVAGRLFYALGPGLLFLLLFVGLAFTGSRAGLAAIVLALLAQAIMLSVHYRRWQAGVVAGGALAVGAAGIALFGLQQGLGRWMETSAYDVTWSSRRVVYQASLELWRDFPLTGTGLGTFRQAFPRVQPADLDLTWLHAHSDVLELCVTTGLVGPAAATFGLVALCRRLWTVFQKGRRSEDRAAGLGALGVVTGALIHSTVDFGLTVPANAFNLAIVCGLACGVATGRRGRPRSGGDAEGQSASSRTDPG